MLKKLGWYLGVGLLSLGLVACGKSDEKKAQDHASDLVTDHNSLKDQLTAMGIPSASWSDEKLNSYESMLNRLEQDEVQLNQANGSNGVIVFNGDNSAAIAANRALLAEARAHRSSNQQNVSSDSGASSSLSKIKELNSQATALSDELQAEGPPSRDWSVAQLKAYDDKGKRLLTVLDQETKALEGRPDAATSLRLAILVFRAATQHELQVEQEILKSKEVAI
jgi:hypothetical protein